MSQAKTLQQAVLARPDRNTFDSPMTRKGRNILLYNQRRKNRAAQRVATLPQNRQAAAAAPPDNNDNHNNDNPVQ